MNRRVVTVGSAILMGLFLFVGQAFALDIASTDSTIAFVKKAYKNHPNIVLIMADDVGYSDIGCYGGEIETPNLDSLAADGLRFTQFYNTARCCPTRASLMTGLYPHQAGIGHMVYNNRGSGYQTYLNEECVTIAEMLKTAGYRTLMTGKWHIGHTAGHYPTDRGFDRFLGNHIHVNNYWTVKSNSQIYKDGEVFISATDDPPNYLHPDQPWYSTRVYTDYALEFLDEAVQIGKPFFLYVAYNAAHWPLEAPDEDIAKYRGRYTEGWEPVRQGRLDRMRQMGIIEETWPASAMDAPDWSSLSADDRDNLDFRRAIYAAEIDQMDQNIGRIMDRLKEHNVFNNSLIIFLSDNGCSAEPNGSMYGYKFDENRVDNFQDWRKEGERSSSQGRAWANVSNTPFKYYKIWTHEGGISTPLIVHWPGAVKKPGTLCHQPGHVVDIMATCVDAARAKYPTELNGNRIKPMAGVSLIPAFSGKTIQRFQPIFWEHEGNWAIRDGKWKLVIDGPAGPWELYDMEADRTELNDLSDTHPEKVSELAGKWKFWAENSNVIPWPWNPPWTFQ